MEMLLCPRIFLPPAIKRRWEGEEEEGEEALASWGASGSATP